MKTAAARPAPAFQPLYRQIKQLITERLESGEWRPGEPIPSEIELAQRFSVSQGTVRKAVAELAGENVLVRQQGRGTFVASHSHARAHLSFLHITPDRGGAERLEARLVDLKRVRADATSARELDLEPGAALIRLRRLLWINGRGPVLLEEVRLPAAAFEGLDARVAEAHRCMLYSMYEAAFGVKVVAADERLKAVPADADTASRLGVEPGSALLQIERVAYTYGGKPVELRRGFCNTRFHHYANALS
jgi:GntR family transcriptional regulator